MAPRNFVAKHAHINRAATFRDKTHYHRPSGNTACRAAMDIADAECIEDEECYEEPPSWYTESFNEEDWYTEYFYEEVATPSWYDGYWEYDYE